MRPWPPYGIIVLPLKPIPPWKSEKGDQDLMDKIIPNCCPRCNSKKLYKYGKDRFGNQKYQCPICKHQFAPDSPKSFESANSMIMMFVFFFNFIRPHSSLSNLTPAQVAGLKYSKRQQNSLLLVSWFSLS